MYHAKLLPECSKCSSPVTDSLEVEIEQHGKIRTGSYANGRWMCHDCIESEEGKKQYDKLVNNSSSPPPPIIYSLLLINVMP